MLALLILLLATPALAQDLAPVPIPGGAHVWAPGPASLGFQGVDVDPSTITDFQGVTALAYLIGEAVDGDGQRYKMFDDMRVFQGEYVGADGVHRNGTFGFVWVDLLEPRSGALLHDYNGGVAASGLFWTVRLPDDALVVSHRGRRMRLVATDLAVIDDGATPNQGGGPATVSFDITWRQHGGRRRLRPSGPVAPTAPAAFVGRLALGATATGSFSGATGAFTFHSDPAVRVRALFAEMGRERNGVFVPRLAHCPHC